jgi:hypothetical protein
MLAVPLRALGTSSRLTKACRWQFVQKSSTNSCAKQCATNEKHTSRTDALPIERFQLDFRILAIWTVCKALWLPAWRAAKHFMQATQGGLCLHSVILRTYQSANRRRLSDGH